MDLGLDWDCIRTIPYHVFGRSSTSTNSLDKKAPMIRLFDLNGTGCGIFGVVGMGVARRGVDKNGWIRREERVECNGSILEGCGLDHCLLGSRVNA